MILFKRFVLAFLFVVLLCSSCFALTAINNWTELSAMQNNLNEDYVLGNSLSSADGDYSGIGDNWNPVGNHTVPFNGTFDGANYTIEDLVVDQAIWYAGLFGEGTANTDFKNVVFKNCRINATGAAGCMVGLTAGDITNVRVFNSSVDIGSGATRGGLLTGDCSGTVNRCWAIGGYVNATIGSAQYFGGLVGVNGNLVNNSYTENVIVTGYKYAGGLVGYGWGASITNSWSSSTVNVSNQYGGGLAGRGGTVTNSYAVGDVSAAFYGGGLIGRTSVTPINCGWYDHANNPSVAIGYTSANVTYNLVDNTLFYDATHDIYDSQTPYWDFSTPIWYEQVADYPILESGAVIDDAQVILITTNKRLIFEDGSGVYRAKIKFYE